jgi:hypothetical protein
VIIRRLAQAIRDQNWFTVVIEFFIVVVGIFVGLQVDAWNESRKERAIEIRYLERLNDELGRDIDEMEYGQELSAQRREMGRLLLQAIDDPEVAESDPAAFIIAIEQAGYTFVPAINDNTFEEIKFAGHLGLIRNEPLREQISAYYKLIERYQQWSYLREFWQTRYSQLGLGILTPEQQMAIPPVRRYNDPELRNEPPSFSRTEAIDALGRLTSRPDFIAQIPQASGKGMELANIQTWLRAAKDLKTEIDRELAKPN